MKKFLGIVVLGLLLSGNAYAGQVEDLPSDTTVNSLLQKGWKLFSSHPVSNITNRGYVIGANYYTLTKGSEVVTCIAMITDPTKKGEVKCFKP